VTDRIQDGEVVRAELGRPVDEAVAVDRGIAPVGGDLIVEIRLGVGPVPLCNDDVPLQALRTGRLSEEDMLTIAAYLASLAP